MRIYSTSAEFQMSAKGINESAAAKSARDMYLAEFCDVLPHKPFTRLVQAK